MSRRMLSLPLLFVALFVLVAARKSDPRNSEQPLVESIQVNVVDVDVTVTDKDGYAVTGLKKDDFVIYEDRKPQTIDHFYEIESRQIRSADAPAWQPVAPTSRFRRRVMIVIDNNTADKLQRNSYLEALRDFVHEHFDASNEWSVLAVDDTVHVVQPLTDDKSLVDNALDRVEAMPSLAPTYTVDRSIQDDPTRAQIEKVSQENSASRGLGSDDNGDLKRALRFESRFNAMRNLTAVRHTADALMQVFHAYSGMEGQKVVILVTGGIQLAPESGYLGDPITPSGVPVDSGSGSTPTRDPQLYQMYFNLRELIGQLAEEANAGQFRIYPVKASGLQSQSPEIDVASGGPGYISNIGAFSNAAERDDNESAQSQLALATGGLSVVDNRPGDALSRIDNDISAYYSLGYTPDHQGDGTYHNIRVEVKRPGLRVRSRKGYVDLSPEQRLAQHLASPLTFEKDAGTLPVALSVARDGKEQVATVSLPMHDLTFVERGQQNVGRIHVYLSIYDAQGQPVDLVRKERDITFPVARRTDALAQNLRYSLRFALKHSDQYTVGMTVVDEISGEQGTAIVGVVN
jgi:VWFA-related protein